jgi:hypothetical protein
LSIEMLSKVGIEIEKSIIQIWYLK